MAEEKKLTVNGKMSKIKKELSQTAIPKSGQNKFAGFKYHELGDFISIINELNEKYGINDVCEIDENQKECRLTLINIDDSQDREIIRIPFREAEMLGKGGSPTKVDAIQRMGSTVTYNRRYLYMTAYNIQENDGVDAVEQHPKKALTEDELNTVYLNIENAETIEDLGKIYNQDTRYKTNKDIVQAFKDRKLEIQQQ